MGHKTKYRKISKALRKLNKLKRAHGVAMQTMKSTSIDGVGSTVDQVSRVKEFPLPPPPPPPPSPPREPTEEELAQMKLEKEKQELKRKLHLDTVDIVGSLDSRALRVRPVKRMKSYGDSDFDDGSEQHKSGTLTEHLRVKCDDRVATPGNGEVDDLHQIGDTENGQSQGADGIPCEKKTGWPLKRPQGGPDGSAAKKKRRPPKSSSKKKKRAVQVLIPKEKIFQMSKPNQACRIIARVYHYLEREYEFIKANTDKSCDLSLLANILKRTADATGFPEPMVKTILEAEEIRKQKLREAAELQHKAEQRKERRLQREFDKNSAVNRKKNKKVNKKSTSEVTKVNSETSSDVATGINSDTLVTSGNVSNEGNSEMTAAIDSDPLADTVKTEVLDEDYGDSLVTGIQQSSKPAIGITITAPTARSHLQEANKPLNGPPQPTEIGWNEPEVYAPPPVTDPEELERIEANSAAGILQALLKRDQDPLG